MSLTIPTDLEREVAALAEAGDYGDSSAVLRDALRVLIAARSDLREEAACLLYEKGSFSLGKAAEWSGLNVEDMKVALHKRGISREAPETVKEIQAMADKARFLAGRA